MKRALLPILSIFMTGCTVVPTPHGKAWFWGDYARVTLVDGPVSFSAVNMRHSGTVRAHWRGAGVLAGQAVAGVIGVQSAGIGAGAMIVAPMMHRESIR